MRTINGLLEFTAKGDFTMYKHLEGLGRDELEDKIGFHKGRMDEGAIIAVIYKPDLDTLTTSDFTFGASSRWSRSSAAAHWAPEYTKFQKENEDYERMEDNAIESALALRGQDVEALKKKTLNFFKTAEKYTPAKVFPIWQHEDWMEYPSAKIGVPQFKLHNKVHWVIKQIILGKSGAV
jgi:hypothetical protein